MTEIVVPIIAWLQTTPLLWALIILMALDITSGIARSIGLGKLSSNLMLKGLMRKAAELIVVGMAGLFDPYTGDVPLSKLVTMAFMVAEGLSILENAVLLGVPVPKLLLDALLKLKTPSTKAQDVIERAKPKD